MTVDEDELGRVRALQAEVERLRSIFARTTESIFCWELVRPMPIDLDLPVEEQFAWLVDVNLVECNLVAARGYGYTDPSEILGKHWREVWQRPPPDQDRLWRQFIAANYELSGARFPVEYPDGSTRVFENDVFGVVEGGALLRFWGTAREITDRVALERELIQAQKLDAVGRLAGAVAHDFNNLLTAIISGLELHRESPEDGGLLDMALSAAERSAELTRRMLGLSRFQVVQRRPIAVAGLARRLEPLLTRLLAPDVHLELTLADELAAVCVDETHLEQLILNLVVNARDAVRTKLEVDELGPGEDRVEVAISAADDDVRITVSDRGPGMSAELQARVFEPFFTTKRAGEGTGLGLDTVKRIVEASSGRVTLDSAPGQGCRVSIFLPRSEQRATPVVPSSLRAHPRQARPVLVIDDEPTVRSLMGQTLRRAGYDAHEFDSAEPALAELFDAEGVDFGLVISDVQLRGTSGPSFVRKLRRKLPDMPVLFVSGFSREQLELSDEARTGFLPKPFGRRALLDAVEDLLARVSAAA